MKNKLFTFYLLIMVATLPAKQISAQSGFRYKANWESIRSHYAVPEWFRDAKFGIFIHWGPYAVPAFMGEKYPPAIYQQSRNSAGMNPWRYHREIYGCPSEFGYKDFIPMFKAEKFDAKEWAELFKNSGARYVVPVAEHHDGFAMYKSAHTRWNSADMGPGRDVLGELAVEVKKRGMKFGASSHFALNWQYYKKDSANWDTNDQRYSDLYSKRKHGEDIDKPSREFLDFWWNRTTDIIDNYRPDILWFDFGIDKPAFSAFHPEILAYYYNKGLEWDKEVVFQAKNFHYESFPEDLIVLDIERGRMGDINKFPWQTDTSVGHISWGYIKHENYKSPDYLIDELIDIVSKNGCLLLNIGPKADGSIPEETETILLNIGDWLKKNGEAIYDTRPWKIYGEGPTKPNTGHHSERKNKAGTSKDFRFTTKNGVLYVIGLSWPDNGNFIIKSLAKNNELENRDIKNITYLGGSSSLKWQQTKEGLILNLAFCPTDEYAYAFKVEFEEKLNFKSKLKIRK
jgi:alpha-L-fucosidase